MDKKLVTRNSKLGTHHHTIHLRHPWQCETKGESTMWSRKFNWPAELSPDEVVQLVIEQAPASATITLNGSAILSQTPTRFDVTALLAGHNRLAISTAAEQDERPEQCPYEVRLEIINSEM